MKKNTQIEDQNKTAAAATYTVKLQADSGYEAEETGRITDKQWGAALAVFADAGFGAIVFEMAANRGK